MRYLFKVYDISSMGNLRLNPDAEVFAQIMVASPGSNSETVYASVYVQDVQLDVVIHGQLTGVVEGQDLSSLSGLVNALFIYRDGVLQESHELSSALAVPFFNFGQHVPALYEGDDVFEGTSFLPVTDAVEGFEGNDTFTGYGDVQSDWFYGGDGIDTSVYRGALDQYTLEIGVPVWDDRSPAGAPVIPGSAPNPFVTGKIVTDNVNDRDGQDQLHSVERLVFSDVCLAFDLDGNAGQTAKILGAVFGKDSVSNKAYAGIGLSLLDGGMSHAELMDLALDTALGSDRTDANVVNLLYTHLVGEAPSAEERDAFVDLITSGAYNQISLAQYAADLDLNATNIQLAGLAETGLAYVP